MNIFLRNVFIRDLPAGNYEINLFLKYIIIRNSSSEDPNLSDLNQLYKIDNSRFLRPIILKLILI